MGCFNYSFDVFKVFIIDDSTTLFFFFFILCVPFLLLFHGLSVVATENLRYLNETERDDNGESAQLLPVRGVIKDYDVDQELPHHTKKS